MKDVTQFILSVSKDARELVKNTLKDGYIDGTLTKNVTGTIAKVSAVFKIADTISDDQILVQAIKTNNFADVLLDEKFSPSTKKAIIAIVSDTVLGKPKEKVKSRKKISVGKPIRDPQGRFTSVVKLEKLMEPLLFEAIKRNMHRPNLRYQTGRFAHSVRLRNIESKQGKLTAFLTYMKYPYATFEKGNKQGHKGYYPSRLIDQAVQDIAKTIVTTRLKTTIV